MPVRLTEAQFDRIVARAIERIPREIRQYLDNIVITVKKRPSPRMMREMEVHPDNCPLGLFQGVPLIERSATTPPPLSRYDLPLSGASRGHVRDTGRVGGRDRGDRCPRGGPLHRHDRGKAGGTGIRIKVGKHRWNRWNRWSRSGVKKGISVPCYWFVREASATNYRRSIGSNGSNGSNGLCRVHRRC